MNTYANQELRHAQGMLERRMELVANLQNAETQKQAIQNHQEICGAVREVGRHRHNILERVDDSSARQANQAGELLKTAEHWLEMSRNVLAGWGVGESDIKRIEGGLLEWV